VPNSGLGFAEFRYNGTPFYHQDGGDAGGRGFNVAAIAPGTGALLHPVRNFDTWGTSGTGEAMNAMIMFLDGLPQGTIVLVAVGDEAGLTDASSCTPLPFPWIEAGLQALETLGSTQLRDYCFRDSWAMVTGKGESQAREEQLGQAVEVSVDMLLTLP
jgi:hypothetical protein